MSKSNNMKKSAMILFVFTIISKLLGIIRESVMWIYYEDGIVNSAYITASNIPNIIFGIIAGGLVSTFIPIYSRIMEKEGKKRATKFMNNILTIIFFMTLTLLVLGLMFTEELVLFTAPGFTGEALEVTINFTKVTLFALLTNGVFSIFTGYHQYEGRFYVTPVTGFFLNFAIISSIVISSRTNPIVLVYGLVIGSLLQLVFSVFVAYFKSDYRYSFVVDFKDRYIRPMVMMALPIIFGQSVGQINNLIDRRIASNLSVAAVTIVNNASKISDAVYSLFVASLTTVMYPTIIKQANRNEYDDLKEAIVDIMNTISIIVIPATIGVIVLAAPIVDLFFNIKQSNQASLVAIQVALMGAIVGLFAVSIRDVLTRTFYALNDSLTPVIASVFAVIVNISLNLILAPIIGVAGLTLATSASAYVGMMILYLKLNKQLKGLKTRRLIQTVTKITIASLIMGAVVYISNKLVISLSIPTIIGLLVSVSVGGLIYLIVLYALKVPEFFEILNLIKARLKIGNK